MPDEEGEIPPQPLVVVERAVEAAEGEEGLSNAKDGYTSLHLNVGIAPSSAACGKQSCPLLDDYSKTLKIELLPESNPIQKK